ncbi:MAG: hypothetical protein WCQ50_19515 [Spirochaetota bacterium]
MPEKGFLVTEGGQVHEFLSERGLIGDQVPGRLLDRGKDVEKLAPALRYLKRGSQIDGALKLGGSKPKFPLCKKDLPESKFSLREVSEELSLKQELLQRTVKGCFTYCIQHINKGFKEVALDPVRIPGPEGFCLYKKGPRS